VGHHAQRRAGCSLATDPRSLVRPGARWRGAASVRLFGQHTDKGGDERPFVVTRSGVGGGART